MPNLRRWQPDLELLVVDATALSADDGAINPAAALLRLQRCRRPAELPGLAATLFGGLRQDGRPKRLQERLADALMRMLANNQPFDRDTTLAPLPARHGHCALMEMASCGTAMAVRRRRILRFAGPALSKTPRHEPR